MLICINSITNKKNCWRHHFTHVYQNQSDDIWFLRYGVRQIFLSFWAIFFALLPPKWPPKIKILIHNTWFLKRHGRQNFLSFMTIFLLFQPSDQPEIRNFEKMKKKKKKHLAILSFNKCVPKITFIWCMVPHMECHTEFCYFGPFFALLPFYPTNNPKNQNFEKKRKNIKIYYFKPVS